MEKTIFQKIIDRELPAEIVCEDEQFIAFLNINPHAPGHTLVVPKQLYQWVWDHPNIGTYFALVQKIALGLRRAYGVEMIRSTIYGEQVPHAHVHVFPECAADNMNDLAYHGALLRSALDHQIE